MRATDDSAAANAASAPVTVSITITGTNDQPVLTINDAAGTLTEGNAAATLTDSGALSFTDLDATDVVTVSKTYNNDIATTGNPLNAALATALINRRLETHARAGGSYLYAQAQQDKVSTLLDATRFALFLTRVMLTIHLWSFRKPDAAPPRVA